MDVFKTLEGPILTVECVEDEAVCTNYADCVTRRLWMEVNEAILNVLRNKTLGDLVEEAEKNKKPSYQI
ncbi:MAG: hypothetical protein BWY69_00618 [Planctomycetes bacterium ADurb.Bin401]|nr:MAG: hypothetical protein BWY69_00618 [Planctomycetes bacterium ADurb.Bin401]